MQVSDTAWFIIPMRFAVNSCEPEDQDGSTATETDEWIRVAEDASFLSLLSRWNVIEVFRFSSLREL